MNDAHHLSGQRFFAVINAGSSSLKYSLFAETDDGRLERKTDGGIEGIGSDKPYFIAYDDDKYKMDEHRWTTCEPLETLLAFLIEWIENFLAPNHLSAVGHRMLHGGTPACARSSASTRLFIKPTRPSRDCMVCRNP